MAINLRLTDDLAQRVRARAREEGRSQQALIVEALEMYLRDVRLRAFPPEIRHMLIPAEGTFDFRGDRSRLSPGTKIPYSSEEIQRVLAELKGDR